MFGVDWQEFLIIGIVALVVIGPKDLPRAMRMAGQWVGKARATARHFRSGIDTMIREAELEEMNTRWAEQNQAIMAGAPAEEAGDVMAGQARLAPEVKDTRSPARAKARVASPASGRGGGARKQKSSTTLLPPAGEATRRSRAGEGVAKVPAGEGVARKPRKPAAPKP